MLTALWRRFVQKRRDGINQRHILYATYEVTDPEVATRLHAWHCQREKAQKAISAYIKDMHAPLLAGPWTTVRYQTDEKGVISKIAYSGYCPPGWQAEPGKADHWMVPADGRVLRELRALPPLSPPSIVADMIGWPYCETENFEPGWRGYAVQFNHLPKVYGYDGRTFVDLPARPGDFAVCPAVAQAVADWRPPPFLAKRGEHQRHRSPILLP